MQPGKRYLCVILLLATMILASCAGLPTPQLVHPSRIGLSTDLAAIMNDLGSYDTYFSARDFNPSALLFVPHASIYTVIPEKKGLGRGWNKVADRDKIKKMLTIIKDRDRMSYPVLKALIRPVSSEENPAPKDLLGFLFSIRSTFAREVLDTPMTYTVYEIPEIPRNGETQKDGVFWRGGFRD